MTVKTSTVLILHETKHSIGLLALGFEVLNPPTNSMAGKSTKIDLCAFCKRIFELSIT